MRLIKRRICVDKYGCLKLPMEFINAAALQPGTELTVTVAMSEEGLQPSPVMVISADMPVSFAFATESGGKTKEDKEEETQAAETAEDFSIPPSFLDAADISVDSDLDVTCVPGAIIIRESDVINHLPEGLKSLFQSFGIHPDTVREVMKKEGYLV